MRTCHLVTRKRGAMRSAMSSLTSTRGSPGMWIRAHHRPSPPSKMAIALHASSTPCSTAIVAAVSGLPCASAIAYDRLVAWLERCPSNDVFDVSLLAIRAKLHSLEPDVHAMLHRRFIGDCTAVSLAADSALADHKISLDEGRVLARILMALRPGRHVFDT